MMRFYSKIRFVIIVLVSTVTIIGTKKGYAQQVSSAIDIVKEDVRGVKVIGRPLKDSIMLRWAPSDPVLWQLANKYGYTLEKLILVKEGKLLDKPVLTSVERSFFKPLPLEQWESLAESDDNAAIIAQAIYGETFDVSNSGQSDVMSIYTKVKELEMRFGFALYAADNSSSAAKNAGLQFTDKQVKPGEKYLYKIYTNIPVEVEKIDTAFIYLGVDDYKPLPAPTEMAAEFLDKTVILSWNRELFDHLYTGYFLEKSDDGVNYFALNKQPYINTSEDKNETSRLMYKTDSLSENYKKYYYRVYGINAFSEKGPYSEVAVGSGTTTFKAEIGITRAFVDDNQKVNLDWKIITEQKDILTGFEIERSNNVNGPFNIITEKVLEVDARSYTHAIPRSTNYYKVTAVNKYGDRRSSHPYLVQLQDSIPPAIPINLMGEVDTLGIVTIAWQPNNEDDLLGYRVYRSNFKNSEFGQITKEPVLEPTFIDSISINTLTSSIYYKVIAVDHRFNPSELSVAVALKRPDIIPPVSPVFKSIKSVDEGIAIEWMNSSSEDVAVHVIYKNKTGENNWNRYKTIGLYQPSFLTDVDVEPGVYYNYTMVAVDSAQLESLPANSVRGIKVDTGFRPKIDNIKTSVDRTNKTVTIHWEYSESDVKEFLIYKQMEEEQLSLYTTVDGKATEFVDTKLIVNSNYKFRIKAIYTNGAESPFSEEIKVKY